MRFDGSVRSGSILYSYRIRWWCRKRTGRLICSTRIYMDGRISVQGIDGVLFPPEEKPMNRAVQPAKVVVKHRRGKLLEAACWMLGTFAQDSRFTTCH